MEAVIAIIFVCLTLVWITVLTLEYLDKRCKIYIELSETRADFEKLKLLNKLRVDWDGIPIIYEKPNEPNN